MGPVLDCNDSHQRLARSWGGYGGGQAAIDASPNPTGTGNGPLTPSTGTWAWKLDKLNRKPQKGTWIQQINKKKKEDPEYKRIPKEKLDLFPNWLDGEFMHP